MYQELGRRKKKEVHQHYSVIKLIWPMPMNEDENGISEHPNDRRVCILQLQVRERACVWANRAMWIQMKINNWMHENLSPRKEINQKFKTWLNLLNFTSCSHKEVSFRLKNCEETMTKEHYKYFTVWLEHQSSHLHISNEIGHKTTLLHITNDISNCGFWTTDFKNTQMPC